jgi:phytoene dehydrogenase-like protein
VYSGNSGRIQVLIIGAGAAGLGAANEALQQGLTVKILEANGRVGGRVNTEKMGEHYVDMGASWIHGLGPGCGEDEEWRSKLNPIYTIALDNGIETVKTWDDEEEANTNYYWWKGPEEVLDNERVAKLQE